MIGLFMKKVFMSTGGLRMHYYAVAKGRKVGVYETWAQCNEQINKFKGAIFKKFPTRSAAEEYIQAHNGSIDSSSRSLFNPQDVAVRLGSKGPPITAWKDVAGTSKSTYTNAAPKDEFWPEPNGDTDFEGEEEITQADLLAAMDEVEGLQPAATTLAKKRKLDAINQISDNKVPKLDSIVLEPAGIKSLGAFEFFIDDSGYVIVYTDGSCINNGKEDAIAGFGVYFGCKHPLNAAKPVTGRATNNVGEIQAAIHAIKIALDLGIKKLCINTDSQFLINSITMWVKAWKRRNWLLSSGEPVKNVVDFKELDEMLETHDIDVKWNYVKAHYGVEGNEMADKLAREGAAMYEAQKEVILHY